MWQFGDDCFGFAGRFKVARVIGKTDDAVGVGDIDPLRVVAVRKQRDPKRLVEAFGKDLVFGRFRGAVSGPQHADVTGFGFRDKDIAVRRHTQLARIVEALREQSDLEAVGEWIAGV